MERATDAVKYNTIYRTRGVQAVLKFQWVWMERVFLKSQSNHTPSHFDEGSIQFYVFMKFIYI